MIRVHRNDQHIRWERPEFLNAPGSGGGPTLTEGPGIDIATPAAVGLGGDTILLYLSNGNPVAEFAATSAGLIAAAAAAVAGNTIVLPSIATTLTAALTLPTDVALIGMDENSIINASGFSGSAITMAADAVCRGFTLNFVSNGNTAIGIDARFSRAKVIDMTVNASGGAVTNIAVLLGVSADGPGILSHYGTSQGVSYPDNKRYATSGMTNPPYYWHGAGYRIQSALSLAIGQLRVTVYCEVGSGDNQWSLMGSNDSANTGVSPDTTPSLTAATTNTVGAIAVGNSYVLTGTGGVAWAADGYFAIKHVYTHNGLTVRVTKVEWGDGVGPVWHTLWEEGAGVADIPHVVLCKLTATGTAASALTCEASTAGFALYNELDGAVYDVDATGSLYVYANHYDHGEVNGTPIQESGDRSAWDVSNYAVNHASDINAVVYLHHLAVPSLAGNIMLDNGVSWDSVPANANVPIPPGARGDIIVANATPVWTALSLGGIAGSLVTRDATDTLWSDYAIIGTAGGITNLDVTATKTLTFVSADDFSLTAERTGAVIVRTSGAAPAPQIVGDAVGAGNARGQYAVDLQLSRINAISVASGNYAVVAGGFGNRADGNYAVSIGGNSNLASGAYASAGGGSNAVASGDYAHSSGSNCQASGNYSYAMGRSAVTGANAGVFIWGDSTNATFNGIIADEFAIRARGGFRHAYDDSNYWTVQVSAAGAVTFNATGASAGFSFSDVVTVPTLNLTAASNQIVFQSAGVTGTITWTPASTNKVVTIPNVTGNVVIDSYANVFTNTNQFTYIGAGIAPSSLANFKSSKTSTVVASLDTSIWTSITAAPATPPAAGTSYRGLLFQVATSGATDMTNAILYGMLGQVTHAGTNTLGYEFALSPGVFHTGSGAISGAITLYGGSASSSGGGTVAVFYGLNLPDLALSGGSTCTISYGIYIAAITSGATNYAIYTNAGAVRFGGSLTVVGAFGCNAAAAQTSYVVGAAAPAGGVGATAGAYDTAAHRDAMITLVNNMRTALINNGIAVAA